VGAGVADAYVDDVQVNSIATDSTNQTAALQVQEGADEGNALSLQLPDISTSNLGIAANTVATSTTAAQFETNIDAALTIVENARAAVGAQMAMLQYQAENDSSASTNLISAESNIRDANIAQTATAFAAEQILSSIGTSVFANIKTLASSVETLFQ
jgi:flagellin